MPQYTSLNKGKTQTSHRRNDLVIILVARLQEAQKLVYTIGNGGKIV